MIDYQITIQKIIESITHFSFEFDFEEIKREMVLVEVPQSELESLGEEEIWKNFYSGVYKIKLPDGKLIDTNSIRKYCIENNIQEPVIFINPEFKYVHWSFKKDFITPQIKKQIKKLLTTNSDINLNEVQKALVIEDVKNKKIDGYIYTLPVKTSDYISEGKFYIQSPLSKESAVDMINEVLEELKVDTANFVKLKIKRDQKYIVIYLIFIVIVCSLWLVNNQKLILHNWASSSIGLLLFLIPLVVMRLINHTIFDTLLFRKKAERKFQKEFFSKAVQ